MYMWGFFTVAILGLVVAGFIAPVLWIVAAVLIVLGLVAAVWSAKHAAEDTTPPSGPG